MPSGATLTYRPAGRYLFDSTEHSAICRQSIDTPSSVNGALSVRSY